MVVYCWLGAKVLALRRLVIPAGLVINIPDDDLFAGLNLNLAKS